MLFFCLKKCIMYTCDINDFIVVVICSCYIYRQENSDQSVHQGLNCPLKEAVNIVESFKEHSKLLLDCPGDSLHEMSTLFPGKVRKIF